MKEFEVVCLDLIRPPQSLNVTLRVIKVELTAHHRDLEAFEVVFHELLTVAASVGPGAVK